MQVAAKPTRGNKNRFEFINMGWKVEEVRQRNIINLGAIQQVLIRVR